MEKTGLVRGLFNFADALIGWVPGGFAYATLLAAVLFGAISGSSVAATTAVGSFMIPEMKKEGYDKDFSAAVTVTSARPPY